MHRTQIFLTDAERKALRSVARRLGRTQSAVIRTAVDDYLVRRQPADRRDLLRQARGIWKDRKDLPDFAALRRSFDRTHK